MACVSNKLLGVAALTLACLAGMAASARGEFTTIAGWDKQIFPSFAVATATIRLPQEEGEEVDETILGHAEGVLGVQLDSPGNNVAVKVTITGNELLEPSTFTGQLPKKGETYTIYPRIQYKYAVLTQNKQATPVTVTFRVEVGSQAAEEKTETLTLRSINDCPFALVDGDKVTTDLSFMFAAYVNEQHPFVDKLLREALDSELVDSFTGYQSGSEAEVARQVYALWNALTERNVKYSSITTTAAESDTVYSQHVRLLDETINNGQANCVDGSVLFASLLRKIGIESHLVFVPGHCYVAFALDAEGESLVALETTLLGSQAPDELPEIEGLDELLEELEELEELLDEEDVESDSFVTFVLAIAAGTSDLIKNADRFADEDEPNFVLMPVTGARKLGILPIGFTSGAKFAPVSE
jgi:Transglutaminase-like superfamily